MIYGQTYEHRSCRKCSRVTFFGIYYIPGIGRRWVCVECGHRIKRAPQWGRT